MDTAEHTPESASTSPQGDGPSGSGSRRVEDIATMRALANPARLNLLGLLRRGEPRTVGMLAEDSGLAVGSVSYHLRTLAAHGFVEPADELARNGRERWWRATSEMTEWHPADLRDDPARLAAMTQLQRVVFQGYADRLEEALVAQASEDPEWLRALTSSDHLAFLTAPELAELSAELEELLERWHRRGPRPRPGARPVRIITHAFPEPRT